MSSGTTRVSISQGTQEKVRVGVTQRGPAGSDGADGPFGPKSITISYPTASEDVTLLYTNQSVTISKISSVLTQNASSNVAFTIRKDINRSNTGTEVKTGGFYCNSNTVPNSYTNFDSATIGANTFMWLETTSATGSVQEFHLTIELE